MSEIRNVNRGKKLSTTSATTLYTCPNNYKARVGTMTFTNVTASDATLTLDWVDKTDSSTAASSEVFVIFKEKPIKANKTVHLDLNKVLEKQDYLRATASGSNVFEISLSIEEKSIQS